MVLYWVKLCMLKMLIGKKYTTKEKAFLTDTVNISEVIILNDLLDKFILAVMEKAFLTDTLNVLEVIILNDLLTKFILAVMEKAFLTDTVNV